MTVNEMATKIAELKQGSLTEQLDLMKPNFRPQLIVVPPYASNDHKIVVVRNPKLPQYGFLVWDELKAGTAIKISFKTLVGPTRSYSLVCICCSPATRRLVGFSWAEDGLGAWRYRKQFVGALNEVLDNHDIRYLMMRRVGMYPDLLPGVQARMIEGTKSAFAEAIYADRGKAFDFSHAFPWIDDITR